MGECRDDIDGGSLSSWLFETYFGRESKAEFAKDDIKRLVDLLTRMMCYLPGDRLSTPDILKHGWFVQDKGLSWRG